MRKGTGKPSTGPANVLLPAVPHRGSGLWEKGIGALSFSTGTVAEEGQAGWAPGW